LNMPPTSVANTTYSNAVSVYPNPAHNTVNIEGLTAGGTYQLQDITGRMVKTGRLQKGTNNITLDVNTGLYVIQVSGNGRSIYTGKLQVN